MFDNIYIQTAWMYIVVSPCTYMSRLKQGFANATKKKARRPFNQHISQRAIKTRFGLNKMQLYYFKVQYFLFLDKWIL